MNDTNAYIFMKCQLSNIKTVVCIKVLIHEIKTINIYKIFIFTFIAIYKTFKF